VIGYHHPINQDTDTHLRPKIQAKKDPALRWAFLVLWGYKNEKLLTLWLPMHSSIGCAMHCIKKITVATKKQAHHATILINFF